MRALFWLAVSLATCVGCGQSSASPAPPAAAPEPSEGPTPTPVPARSPSQWTLLYALPESQADRWFSSVWASETGQVVAVGNVLVTGRVGERFVLEPSPFDAVLLDVWGPDIEKLYAVGARGAIVRFDGKAWSVDRGPSGASRGRDELLHSVGSFLGSGSVVAFGPESLLARAADGGWVTPSSSEADQVRQRWGGFGLGSSPCAGATHGWFADRAGDAWVRCADGKVFALTAKGTEERGRSPSSCDRVGKSAFWQGALYTSCGGRMWKNERVSWTEEPTPSDIRQFAPTRDCLYAVGARQILRKCSDGAPR